VTAGRNVSPAQFVMGDRAFPEGQFDDAEEDRIDGGPTARLRTSDVILEGPYSVIAGPSNCALRTRAQDAEVVACELRSRMDAMEPGRLAELVRARRSAAGITDVFPEGDQRFAPVEPDDDDEVGVDIDGGEENDSDSDINAVETDRDGNLLGSSARRDPLDDEPCAGLFDGKMDAGPHAALMRAKDLYGVDLLAAMTDSKLDFFERIRLVNYIRTRVRAGDTPEEAASAADAAIMAGRNVGILANDVYLKPVVPGDVLLTVLDTAEDDDADDVAKAVERGFAVNKVSDDSE
jgi:hypothetical protein